MGPDRIYFWLPHLRKTMGHLVYAARGLGLNDTHLPREAFISGVNGRFTLLTCKPCSGWAFGSRKVLGSGEYPLRPARSDHSWDCFGSWLFSRHSVFGFLSPACCWAARLRSGCASWGKKRWVARIQAQWCSTRSRRCQFAFFPGSSSFGCPIMSFRHRHRSSGVKTGTGLLPFSSFSVFSM